MVATRRRSGLDSPLDARAHGSNPGSSYDKTPWSATTRGHPRVVDSQSRWATSGGPLRAWGSRDDAREATVMPDQRFVGPLGVMNGLHLCHDKDVVADGYELVDDAREADPGVLQHRDAVHVGHPTGGRGEPVGTGSRECRGQLAGMRGQKVDADSSYLLERRPHARRAGYQQRDERRPQADRGERRDSQPDRTTPFGCGQRAPPGRVLTQGLPQLLADGLAVAEGSVGDKQRAGDGGHDAARWFSVPVVASSDRKSVG